MNAHSRLPWLVFSLLASACAGATTDDDPAQSTASAMSTGAPGCPGTGWTVPTSWSGLQGSYLRGAQLGIPADEITYLDVLADPPRSGAPSTSYLRLSGGAVQSGTLLAEPANPAAGPTFLFEDAAGNPIDVYYPEWITRDPTTGHVQQICLEKASRDPSHVPFAVARVGL